MAEAPVTLKVESDALRQYLRGVPAYVSKGMAAAAVRAGQSFLAYHKRLRLSAKSEASSGPLRATGKPQTGESRQPGTGFIGRRFFYVTGDSIDNSTLRIRLPGGPAKAHELGLTLKAKAGQYLPVPMPAAKNASGRVAGWVKNLMRREKHILQAESAGFKLKRRKSRVRRVELHGKLFIALFKPSGKGGETFVPLFHLQKMIRQRPRLEFLKTWRSFESKAAKIYRQALPYAIRAAAKKSGITSIALPEGLGNG